MIAFFRKWLTSWAALALLGIVMIAFIVTGVGDFGGGAGGGAGSSLARIGGRQLGENDLNRAFEQALRRARETDPAITAQQVAAQGGVEQVFDTLVATTALEEYAAKLGLSVSERAIDGEIASIPAFQIGGRFSESTFRQALAQQRLSERELRDGIRRDLLRRQLVAPLLGGAPPPRALAEPYARLLLDVHRGAIALVPLGPPPPPPTPAQLSAFYKANFARFTVPERRGFRYALLPTPVVTPTEAEIAAFYKANAARFGGVERRELLQVVLPDRAAADRFVAAVRGGESFAAAAQRLAQASAADIALGTVTEAEFGQTTSPAVAKAAFAAPAGGIGGPVQSDFGWHVVSPARVLPAAARGLEAARAEIAAELARTRAADALAEAVAKLEDGISEGASFADLVRDGRLTPVVVAPATSAGRGVPPAAAPEVATLRAEAFKGASGDEPAVVDLGEGRFALFELGEIVPPAAPPLARIEPAVRAAYVDNARREAARRTAEAIAAEVGRGATLATVVAKRGLPAPTPIAARPIDLAQQRVASPAARAFLTLPPRTTRAMPDDEGRGWLVLHVDAVEPGKLDGAPQLVESARAQFARSAPDELAAAFARAVETELDVSRNPAAVAAARRRLAGEDDASGS